MSVVKHSAWAAAAALTITVSRFLLAAVLARKLPVEDFGAYIYIQWLVDIGFLLCTLGATGVASRYFAQYRADTALLSTVARYWRPWSLGLPVVASLVVIMAVIASGLEYSLRTYLLLGCWSLFSGIKGMHAAALTGLQRFDLIFVANLLASSIMLVGALLVPDGSHVDTVILLMMLASLCASVVGILPIARIAQGEAATLDQENRQAIYRYAVNIWITALLWNFVWSRGEIPVIRNLLGDAAVAYYSVALTVYGSAITAVMLAISGVAPQITRYWGANQKDDAIQLCRRAMDLQLLVAGAMAVFLIWLGPELMRLMFGERYADAYQPLAVLAIGLPALSLSTHNHLLQITTGAVYNRNTTLLGALLLLGFSYIGVSGFGLDAAAWARAMTLTLLGLITVFVVYRPWRQQALSLGNLVWVYLLVVASVWLHGQTEFSITTRLALLLLVTGVMILAVRTAQSTPVFYQVAAYIVSKFPGYKTARGKLLP